MSKTLPLVSVVINTYNRFDQLLLAIKSVKNQTHKNVEIIVVNDKSEEIKYYDKSLRPNDVIWIDLESNSRDVVDSPHESYVTNIGMEKMTGEFFAKLDDDDYWLPNKLEVQLKEMQKHNAQVSVTDAYVGFGSFQNKHLQRSICYHKDLYRNSYIRSYHNSNTPELRRGLVPQYINTEHLSIANLVIHSSVLVSKKLLDIHNLKYDMIRFYGDIQSNGDVLYCDLEMSKKYAKIEPILSINTPLLYYQLKPTKVTKTKFMKRYLLTRHLHQLRDLLNL